MRLPRSQSDNRKSIIISRSFPSPLCKQLYCTVKFTSRTIMFKGRINRTGIDLDWSIQNDPFLTRMINSNFSIGILLYNLRHSFWYFLGSWVIYMSNSSYDEITLLLLKIDEMFDGVMVLLRRDWASDRLSSSKRFFESRIQ